jgi:hypothetical protein
MHKHCINGKLQEFNKNRLSFAGCLHWQSQKRDPPNFGSGLAALPPRSLLPQLIPVQTQAPARSFRQGVLYDMQMHYDSSIELKKLSSVLNSEIA